MNWKLAAFTLTLSFTVGAVAQSLVPIPITMSGPSPWIDVRAYGAVGDGMNNDQPAIQAAITSCPTNGCTVYFPSSATYKINNTLTISPTQVGIRLLGECGASGHIPPPPTPVETCSRLVSSQPIILLQVGTAGTAFQSGLVIKDLGFQDKMGGVVTGAIDLIDTQDFTLENIHCRDISIGYCLLFDGHGIGSANFTQFGVVTNLTAINVKFPVQITPQASEINFYGGNLNCNGIPGSIGMDLGQTFPSHGNSSGGEWGVFGTHTINCLTGISMYNTANMNFYGIIEEPNMVTGADGIIIDGDTSHTDKNTIAGSIDGFLRGITLGATTNNRVLATITNTSTPIVASGTALTTAFILTATNYSGVGGPSIGTQIPTDLTMPEETLPLHPASGSRRIYVDLNAGDDVTAERSDGTTVDLESGLRSYQKPLPTITGTGADQTVYTFSIPSIPPGKGVRAKVYWQCVILFCSAAQTFKWQFGTSTLSYNTFTSPLTNVAYTQVSVFNDPGSQSLNTMVAEAITIGTSLVTPGAVTSPNLSTNTAQSLSFIFNSSGDKIVPTGFVLETIQ